MAVFYDGGDAFPTTQYYDERPIDIRKGMSLRDYFAGQALIGLMASCAGQDTRWIPEEQAAEQAYSYADALLAKRRESSGRTYKLEGGRR